MFCLPPPLMVPLGASAPPTLARVSFFVQHMGGGLLDKTDATLKAELQALLPLPTLPMLPPPRHRQPAGVQFLGG